MAWPCTRTLPSTPLSVFRIAKQRFFSSTTSSSSPDIILGIESSCDDSAAAAISISSGAVLGSSIVKQSSSRFGGVLPSMAMGLHAKNVPVAVKEALSQANLSFEDLSSKVAAIAVTNRPGLAGSLRMGLGYAQYLCIKHNVPMIPIHHMEAHALTARLIEKVEFPFMVLLISGGHCLLAMAEDINRFLLLGQSRDCSPGEVLDKAARRLKLHSVRTDLSDVSGGRAIEIVASQGGNPAAIQFPIPMRHEMNCNFSFSGLKSNVLGCVSRFEEEQGTEPDELISNVADVCASFQYSLARHICHRLQRGLVYAELNDLWAGKDRALVVSGGVAANAAFRGAFEKVCSEFDCRAVFPPASLCTDNGVMIAWNGVEKWRRGADLVEAADVLDVDINPRVPFGTDVSLDVQRRSIRCKWVNILKDSSSSPSKSSANISTVPEPPIALSEESLESAKECLK